MRVHELWFVNVSNHLSLNLTSLGLILITALWMYSNIGHR